MYKVKRFSLLNATTGKLAKGAKKMNKALKNEARVGQMKKSTADWSMMARRSEAENLKYMKARNPLVNASGAAGDIRASRRYNFGN